MSDSQSANVGGDSTSAASDTTPSCIPYFDALWFCYSPVYQMREYYVEGKLDDCSQHWKDFWDCLRQKTRYKDEVLKDSPQHPLWELKTPQEAAEKWSAEFGSPHQQPHEGEPVVA